jgi:peptidoglycan hydrolase CwlO-like protein
MQNKPLDSMKSAEDRKVPGDLLDKLHDANAKLHDAKEQLDATMKDSEMRHQGRVDEATAEFRSAEQEVEQITEAIHHSPKRRRSATHFL